jgi:2-polyprenyl-6-methoxyphenol hydroxylase-like FAD-dependent oxidoreductase
MTPKSHIQTNRPLRVIVVGGGIGGLSAAIALRRQGHDVVVLERAPRLEPLGAGLALFGNAMDALERLEVADAVAATGAPIRQMAFFTSDGQELTALPRELLSGAISVHRGDLQTVLLEAAGDITLGAAIESVFQTPDGVVARTTDGAEAHGDLLVGADGARSIVRAAITTASTRYAGYTVWRGVSPVALEPGLLSETWGSGERFGLGDLGDRTYWYATANAPEGGTETPRDRKAGLLQRFGDWHTPIARAIESTAGTDVLRNDVHFLHPLRHWSEGRIVLLGDAAHATTPGIGQGAAQAIEDAVVLADAISRHYLPRALEAYETARRPRAELTLKLSRRADRAGQLTNPLGRRLRNHIAQRTSPRAHVRQLGPIVQHQLR